jgi:hypothetical protein
MSRDTLCRLRTRSIARRVAAFVLGLPLGLAGASCACAQVQLPARLPSVPVVPELARRVQEAPVVDTLTSAAPLAELRRTTVRDLLARHADALEPDPAGNPVVRSELLLASPPQSLVDAAIARGYRLLRTDTLPGLDERIVVLAPPPGVPLATAAARLRGIDPGVTIDFNHLFIRSGSVDGAKAQGRVQMQASPRPAAPTAPPTPPAPSLRIGLIDGGVDTRHPALQHAAVQRWGCEERAVPSPHGTAVASLLVGDDAEFVGSAPRGARLFAADIYCDAATGGAAERLLQALAWMAGEKVPVINVSLVGPPNRLLERVVGALHARGHLIVAAVGNDGPAAPPLYPAAYPGVIGVTGVGPSNRVLPEAAQGPQVMFAAPGAELAVARAGESGYVVARGTSFAAPTVAGLLCNALPAPDPDAASLVLRQWQQRAVDLGAPGRDDVYGWGLLDWSGRVPPQRLHARRDAAF